MAAEVGDLNALFGQNGTKRQNVGMLSVKPEVIHVALARAAMALYLPNGLVLWVRWDFVENAPMDEDARADALPIRTLGLRGLRRARRVR